MAACFIAGRASGGSFDGVGLQTVEMVQHHQLRQRLTGLRIYVAVRARIAMRHRRAGEEIGPTNDLALVRAVPGEWCPFLEERIRKQIAAVAFEPGAVADDVLQPSVAFAQTIIW